MEPNKRHEFNFDIRSMLLGFCIYPEFKYLAISIGPFCYSFNWWVK